jgi:hypothetical protein
MVMHVSSGDVFKLREPEYVRADLPLFRDKLRLDDFQNALVASHLEAYLQAFKSLADEMMPTDPAEALGLPGIERRGDGDGEHDGEGIGEIVRRAVEGQSGEGIDFEGQGTISIGIAVGMDGGVPGVVGEDVDVELGDDPGMVAEEPGVTIAISPPEDVEIPEELRQELEAKAKQMAEEIRAQLEEAQAAGDIGGGGGIPGHGGRMDERMAMIEQMAAEAERFRRARSALRLRFEQDVQGELTEGQQTRWPSLERALTRRKTLPLGELDGERTDLLGILEDLELDDVSRQAITEQAETFELDLDAALSRRNSFLDESDAKLDKALKDGRPEQAVSLAERESKLRVAVRDVNHRYAEALAMDLPEDRAAELRSQYARRSYPRVFRTTRAQRAFESTLALHGLEPEVLASIEELSGAYETELDRTKKQLRQIIDRHQPEEGRRQMEALAAMMSGELPREPMRLGEGDDPISEAMKQRRELGGRYIQRIRELLTEDQIAAVRALAPRRPSEPIIIERQIAPPY